MEETEFEKYYERIKGCFVGCEIIKNSYSRNTIKEILEEIWQDGVTQTLKFKRKRGKS